MIQIYDDASLEAALATPLDATTRDLVDRIVSDARASDLWELTSIAIVDGKDDDQELEGMLGFDPLTGPLGYDEEGQFVPWWNFMQKAEGYCELLHCVGDFAYYVLVAEDGPSRLAAACRGLAGTMES